MIFRETELRGAYLIDVEEKRDARGFFARLWCEREFSQVGLSIRIAQISMSYNERKGTLRGLHYQRPPHEETKLVRCTRGAIYDVIVDMRQGSPTYLQWRAFTLRARERSALYVPGGFAHGFQTLEDDTEVQYQISEFQAPGFEMGIRYDTAVLHIAWPLGVTAISDRDLSWTGP